MQYHPHRKDGFRLADGENMERLWSFLDGFAYMSREMTPANRRNLIVDALVYIGNKVVSNAGKFEMLPQILFSVSTLGHYSQDSCPRHF